MKRNVNYTELAKLAGCSKQYVAKLVAQGRIPLNDDGTINRVVGLRILAEVKSKGSAENGNRNGKGNGKEKTKTKTGKPSLNQEQARLAGHKADIAEMESKQLAGTLVTIDEVDTVFGKLVTAVRQRFLGMGSRLAPNLSEKTPASIKREIDNAVHEALNEFGHYNAESGKCEIPSKKHKSIKRKTQKKFKRGKK